MAGDVLGEGPMPHSMHSKASALARRSGYSVGSHSPGERQLDREFTKYIPNYEKQPNYTGHIERDAEKNKQRKSRWSGSSTVIRQYQK